MELQSHETIPRPILLVGIAILLVGTRYIDIIIGYNNTTSRSNNTTSRYNTNAEAKPQVGTEESFRLFVLDFYFALAFPCFFSFVLGIMFGVINVEDHAAHCRMANAILCVFNSRISLSWSACQGCLVGSSLRSPTLVGIPPRLSPRHVGNLSLLIPSTTFWRWLLL